MTACEQLRVEKAVYGGDGLAHTASGEVRFVPFALPGELVELDGFGARSADPAKPGSAEVGAPLRILEPSRSRVEPRCVHFGVCGGCQYQMADYPAQPAMKEAILRETLARAGVLLEGIGAGRSEQADAPDPDSGVSAEAKPWVQTWPSSEPYGYRNRIRLRVRRLDGELRLGYSVRGTNDFLPVTMCPIAASLLWRAAEALMGAAAANRDLTRVLEAAAEAEFFCDGEQNRLQLTIFSVGKMLLDPKHFGRAMEAFRTFCPELAGAGLMRVEPRSGRALEVLASWGTAGLAYPVLEEAYWITRGGFFQVNRFLLPTLVDLVCGERAGGLAWDLFAGVGLFSRVLARRFGAVTAVEANPVACADLSRALAKLGSRHSAVQATTLDYLRRAALQRERPELIVLDPPRAGAGEEACRLLAQLAPAEIVYLSCDPTTLARDLAVLNGAGYTIAALHLIDLFPQTYHLETLAVLRQNVAD